MFYLYLTQDAELEVEPLSSLKDSSAPRMASSTQQRPVNTGILTVKFQLENTPSCLYLEDLCLCMSWLTTFITMSVAEVLWSG